MTRKLLLRLSAFFALFTFLGHSVGGVGGPPADQTAAVAVYEMMKQTMVTMPIGPAKSLATMGFGADVCLSIFLLVSGLLFIILSTAKEKATRHENQILLVNSLGMLATGVVSFMSFFPVPAVCTAIAGILGIVAMRRA